MSPFRSKGAKTWKGRVRGPDGTLSIKSLGTTLESEARLIEAWCEGRFKARDVRVVDAIHRRIISPAKAYFAAQEGRLAAVLDALEQASALVNEPDLDTHVGEWARVARSAVYVRQVRAMIPEGRRFPVSAFTRAAISKFLASRTCADPTRNRYRVALSQFARWLVERDVILANPVRDVRGFKERDPRMVYFTRDEAKAVIRRIADNRERAAIALMCGTGLEVSAVLALRRRDVTLATREVMARGTKNRWRTRTVRVTEPWCWDYVTPIVRAALPDAPLFPALTERHLIDVQVAACKAADVQRATLHDWRHTYAIQALRDGLPAQTVKRQLGHSPHSTMLERVYSAWIPATDADYLPRNATNPATSARREAQ